MLTLDEVLSLNFHERVIQENGKFLICGASIFKGRPGEAPIVSKKNGIIITGVIQSWENCSFCWTPTKKKFGTL
ncbi:MAG: hypothetical protein PHP37_00240 [Patescibacteria group bacterium]|nr:hypothetical protein [Patescibacteria group bacterium]